jgi:hypothetical protein
MTKVSAVILAYNRPNNINRLVTNLYKLKEIDEIVILYGNKNYVNGINNNKVIEVNNWEENDRIYLLRRYDISNYYMIKNDCVLLLDDDLYPSQKLLSNMVKQYNINKNGLYGPQSRYCGEIYINVENKKNLYFIIISIFCSIFVINMCLYILYSNLYTGIPLIIVSLTLIILIILRLNIHQYNTIIPGLSIIDKNVISRTWVEMNKPYYKHIFNDVINHKGNGEDLFFNIVYRKLYGNPTFVKGKYYNLDSSNGFSTTESNKHYRFRNNFCKKYYKK